VAAQREVLSAFRRQESARLAFLPDISISLVGGRLDDNILSLLRLNPWLASAAFGVSLPIYTGGARLAVLEIATARQAEAVARYGAQALLAFAEVENALANEAFLAERLTLEERALASRSDAVRIATLQYKAGRRDLLWVSSLQTAQIETHASVIKLRATQRFNRVQLYLGLGGSFDSQPALPTSNSESVR
jgi:outer membrane protein TolC